MKLLVYHVAVGNLPKKVAQKHVKSCGKKLRKTVGKKPKIFLMPVRDGESWLEQITL